MLNFVVKWVQTCKVRTRKLGEIPTSSRVLLLPVTLTLCSFVRYFNIHSQTSTSTPLPTVVSLSLSNRPLVDGRRDRDAN